jgi:hypothetical protein
MFGSTKAAGLRRMKLEELLSKLEQIEQQAALTLHEYPNGLTVERQRLIMAIAKQVQSHLKDQLREGVREPLPEELSQGRKHLRSVDGN